MPVKAVIFDMDETLVVNRETFASMRRRYERRLKEEGYTLPEDSPGLLEGVKRLCEERADLRPMELLEEFELQRARGCSPVEGVRELLQWLRMRNIKVAVVTRNSRKAALRALKPLLDQVDLLMTRDDEGEVKPHPGQIRRAMRTLGVEGGECVVVGDYIYDVEAGRAAGCLTVCVGRRAEGDINIENLEELKSLLQKV